MFVCEIAPLNILSGIHKICCSDQSKCEEQEKRVWGYLQCDKWHNVITPIWFKEFSATNDTNDRSVLGLLLAIKCSICTKTSNTRQESYTAPLNCTIFAIN